MTNELTCPHCRHQVPYLARVCLCNAEIEYGAPRIAYWTVAIVAVVLGWKAGVALHPIAGWVIAVIALGGGIYGCTHVFRERVVFKRIYRTR